MTRPYFPWKLPCLAAILLGTLMPAQGVAQEEAPAEVTLSIEEALRRAEETSESVDIARAGVLRAEGEKLRATSGFLPQLNATASYDRTLYSEFDFLRNVEPPPEAAEGGAGGADFFADLPFGRRNTWRVGGTLSQNLFTGGRLLAQRRLASSGFESARVSLESARASAVLQAAEAYYDAVLSERLVEIAEASFQQAEQTLAQVRAGEGAGARPEFDVLRAEVTLENERPNVLRSRIARDLANLRLRQVLELPMDQRIRLTTRLGDEAAASVVRVAREAAHMAEAEAPRAPVLLARESVRIREASVDIAQSQRWPSLSLNSTFGGVNYPDALLPGFSEWRPNWTVGLGLQVPLFTGFRITADVRTAEADLMEARAQHDQVVELVRLDTLDAAKALEASELVWEATATSIEQAERAYGIAELRYREGISTQLELADARLLLEQARATRASAARELQVARIRVALLPRLPLDGMALQGGGSAAMSQRPRNSSGFGSGGGVPGGANTGAATGVQTNPSQTGASGGRGPAGF